MQAIPAHHTNACCAGQSNFQQSQILVNLCNAVKPKASSSSDQNSQSRINYAPKSGQNPQWTKAINSILQMTKIMPLRFIWCLQPESHPIPIWQIQATPVHLSMNGHGCAVFLLLSADDCRRAQFVPL